MSQWDDGYVSDLTYPGGVYRQQMPSHLETVCLIAGVAPAAEPDAPFTYCELGCGIGDTAMTVAAAYPQARVWGYDFNPAHIAEGNACARASGLDNIVFEERSFQDLAQTASADMPMFDYVTAHGVWSWVSAANRAHIVTFLARFLRPGGLFSVSYNALPGWTGTIGLQHLLREAGRRAGEDSETRIRQAIGLARRMVDVGGSSLGAGQVATLESILAKGEVRYLSHEYLNEHWSPAFHADVVSSLAPAKMRYVGSAHLLENFPQLCAKPEQNAFLNELPASLRETVQDYFCPRSFRRDVFVRGPRSLSAGEWETRLRAQRLVLIVPPGSTSRRVSIPIGEATLSEAFYAPALAALHLDASSVGALLDAAAPGTAPATREIAAMMVGTAQVLPACASPSPETTERVRRVNLVRIRMTFERGQQECWLASAVAGAAIKAGLMEMLIYEVVAGHAGREVASIAAVRAGVRSLMSLRSMSINENATEVAAGDDPDVAIEAFIAETLPIWTRLGML